ncbi:MAG: succinate dehydrogenase iron-sulfur subunit [Bryobacterales bacterium]|jgi:succinate dehydrogenase / fumarate reductase iron-sulfur subunit|nr:succinate dehydrogenase iron-sulfur subunit [Bryobacterales bacterium]
MPGEAAREVRFHVTRYNPERDAAPYVQTFTVPVREGMTVLDGLHYIKENLDASLVWRYSCRMGVCGSCGMLLNGRPMLACNTQILHIAGTDLTVGPLPNFDIIRDLVPDLVPMFQKHLSLNPFIVREDDEELNDPAGEFYQSPQQLEEYLQFTYCIKCGLCMAGCPTLATDARFLGPMPLTSAQRYNSDTRDGGRGLRREQAGSPHGAFRCHYAGECSHVCPKGVDPAKAIQHLKRSLVLDYLHLARKRQPCEKMHGPGQGQPLANIAAPPARTV